MSFTTRMLGTIPVIEIHDRFDAHVAPAIITWLERAAAGPDPRIIVDMRDVPFIDSAGLSALMRGMKRTRQRGGDLALCGMQQAVQIIFQLTKMHRAFSLYPNEEAALTAFQS